MNAISIWSKLNLVRSLPAVITYKFSKNKGIIDKDIERWVEVKKLGYLNYPTWYYLHWLLLFSEEFRNLFYYRLNNRVLAKMLNVFYPKLDSLYISTKDIGPGLYISHGFSTIIVAKSIGENCWINQQVTVGYGNHPVPPVIGDNVRIGAGAIVVGNIIVGDNSMIGAGAVVAKNVEEWSTMVGNPASLLKKHGVLR